MTHQYRALNDTVYFWVAANDTSGSGGDGATASFDVRIAGESSSAAPTLSGTPSLLSHASYPAGCYEIAVSATVGNGFSSNDTFSVFCSMAIDSQNPSGFVGSCTLTEIANKMDVKKVISIIESHRGGHTHQGNIYYVDPVNGDTHANGNRGGASDPYSLVQDCHDSAVTDNNHDLIILVSGDDSGTTVLTEAVSISKNYLMIRGPGRDFDWTRSGSGDTISITGNGVELSGFQVNTAATGSGAGITATGSDFLRFYRLWINDTRGDGLDLINCNNCDISKNHFKDTGQGGSGHGLSITSTSSNTSNDNKIHDNNFIDVSGDAIRLDSTGSGLINDTIIRQNHIVSSSGYGLNVLDGSVQHTIASGNDLANNLSGSYNDLGVDTHILDFGDARPEPGQGVLPSDADMATKVDYIYKFLRNKKDNDGSTTSIYADDGVTVDHKMTTSESGGTVTVSEVESGP